MDPALFDPTYLVTLDEVFHAHWAAKRRARIRLLGRAAAELWPQGHPSKMMQVTGTNGKGSVCTYLAQGLQPYGPVGTWTGPHVFDYAERFHINGEQASRADINDLFRTRVRPLQDRFTEQGHSLTFAELGILLALCLFERHGVTWGIMEVGNGGRYTPLMALPMAACLLTNVGDDHPKSLGEALWQRALEKAGIARPGIPFFTTAQDEALAYVVPAAEAEGAPVTVVDDTHLRALAPFLPPDQPAFVHRNLALAGTVVRHFYPDAAPEALFARMRRRLPARFWEPTPGVVVDVAHNPDKIARLAEELHSRYPGRRCRFLLGLSRSRDPLKVFAPLLPLATELVVTSASHAGQDPAAVAEVLKTRFAATRADADPCRAYQTARAACGEAELLVVTGSAYMIDQALNPDPFVRETNACYGRRYKQNGPIP